MATQTYQLVNPVTEPVIAPFDGAPRLPTLAGTRVGLIDDSKRKRRRAAGGTGGSSAQSI